MQWEWAAFSDGVGVKGDESCECSYYQFVSVFDYLSEKVGRNWTSATFRLEKVQEEVHVTDGELSALVSLTENLDESSHNPEIRGRVE